MEETSPHQAKTPSIDAEKTCCSTTFSKSGFLEERREFPEGSSALYTETPLRRPANGRVAQIFSGRAIVLASHAVQKSRVKRGSSRASPSR